MKRIISLILVVMLFSVNIGVSADNISIGDDVKKMTDVTLNDFMILGTHYYKGMDVIENRSQLDYEFFINEINFSGNNITLKGDICKNESVISSIDEMGILYKSIAEKLQKVNGITAVFSEKTGTGDEILSCAFERNADVGELLPVNEELGGKTVIKIAIRNNNEILYFEGEIPISNNYTNVYNSVLEASGSKEAVSVFNGIKADTDISEKEAVQLKELWKQGLLACSGEAEILDDNKKEVQTRASSPLVGVPVSVFKQEGSWASVNNPSNQYMGYYAVTYPVSGTNNFVTSIIKWEYLYNPCGNIGSSNVASGGTTGFNISKSAEYTYYAVRDSIEFTNSFIPYRIKNAAVAMGLQSDEQIITYVNRRMQANASKITVNWTAILGLLPLGEYYSAASNLFSAITYKNNNISTSDDSYQASANGQKSVYGKLVRGHKLTDNGKYFIKDGDKMNIIFEVSQPNDLTKTSRTNYIGNKYYFEIFERNPYTLAYSNCVYTVNQIRTSSYYVQ